MRILAAGPGRSRADEGAPRFFAARRNGHPITLKEASRQLGTAYRYERQAYLGWRNDHLRTPERIYRSRHHRMVALAAGSSSRSTEISYQTKITTVMLVAGALKSAGREPDPLCCARAAIGKTVKDSRQVLRSHARAPHDSQLLRGLFNSGLAYQVIRSR